MDFLRVLLGLPARVGQIVTAPDPALARVEAEGGGLRDALALVVAAVVAFRLPELVHARAERRRADVGRVHAPGRAVRRRGAATPPGSCCRPRSP